MREKSTKLKIEKKKKSMKPGVGSFKRSMKLANLPHHRQRKREKEDRLITGIRNETGYHYRPHKCKKKNDNFTHLNPTP